MSLTCPNCGAELGLALEVLSGTAAVERNGSRLASVLPHRSESAAEPQLADMGLDLDLGSRSTPTTNPSPKKDLYEDPDFQAFWKVYPLRRGKWKAAQRFAVARRMVSARTILAAAAAYAREVEGQDPSKIKWPEGWLNDHRWEDEMPEPAQPSGVWAMPTVGTPEYDAWVEAEERKAMEL